ncbi:MAG: hypothetical protein V1928_01165 [Parcubacteria group bacterium]
MILGDHGDMIPHTSETIKTLLITGLTTGRLGLLNGMMIQLDYQEIFNVYVSMTAADKDQEKAQIDYFENLADKWAHLMNVDLFVPGKYSDQHKMYKFTPEEIKQMNETHLARSRLLIADVREVTPEIEHDLNFARHNKIPIVLIYDDWEKSVGHIVRTNSFVRGTILFSNKEGTALCLENFLNTFFKIDEMKRLAKEKQAQEAEQDV